MAAELRERWADEVGFTDDEWSDFVRLRRWYRSRKVTCPWCSGAGRFEDPDTRGPCPACASSGRVDRWLALHEPCDDDQPVLFVDDLSPRLSRLRSRLENYLVSYPDCDGAGHVGRNYCCRTCNWAGRISAFKAAAHAAVACPRCNRFGVGGVLGLEWGCGYCSMTGQIDIDRLHALSWIIVGEYHGLFLNIEDAVRAGNPRAYQAWWHEFNVREEAMPGVRWAGVEFSGDDLSGLDFSRADLSGCLLGDVTGACFVGANLSGVTFRGNIHGADFTGADLSEAHLSVAMTYPTRQSTWLLRCAARTCQK